MRSFLTAAAFVVSALTTVSAQNRGTVSVSGHVVDVVTGEPVVSAVVELVATQFRGVTNVDGRFEMRDVLTGEHMVRISHISYGTRTQRITIPRTRHLDVEIRLDPKPIEVAGIEVNVLSEEERRVRSAAGRYSVVLEPKIDRAASMGRRVSDVLRQELGLRVREGVFVTPESMDDRAERIVCVESGRGSTRLRNPVRTSFTETKAFCEMVQIFVDDVHLGNAGNYLTTLDLNNIARIEYMSPNQAAVKFGLAASDNGVLLLYMKKR